MPEGPEVRRNADQLDAELRGKRITALTARTKAAKAYLAEHPGLFEGRRIEWVRSRGKNLVGLIEGGHYFYVHLMMWGHWTVVNGLSPDDRDRRERARITVEDDVSAVLFSAPVFEIGETTGDPFEEHPYLRALGPDILPYPGQGPFAVDCFIERLYAPENRDCEIGSVLLDQMTVAGIGNYLRAELLFVCGIDPFCTVASLSPRQLADICHYLPEIAERAYRFKGVTVSPVARERIRADAALRYPNSKSEWSGAYFVFRRTNLPCVICGKKIRQRRQVTYRKLDGDDRERIIYFCPVCQGVDAR